MECAARDSSLSSVGRVTPLERGRSAGDCSIRAPNGPGAQRREASGPRAPNKAVRSALTSPDSKVPSAAARESRGDQSQHDEISQRSCCQRSKFFFGVAERPAATNRLRWEFFFGTSLHPISRSPGSPSLTRNASQIAEAFSPRTMAAADAGGKPTRLSATPARVRAQ